jgi:capsular exopolysaccharide synthesis family protein
VLVVDADLRRPSLHRYFRVDNTTGLTNLLTNTVASSDVSAVFRPTQFERVTFLPSGPMIPNPADMLSSHRMGAVVHACAKAYDMVLVDGPPVLGLSDALILSRLAEATLLVVSAHQVARKTAKAALKRLQSAGGHIVGATLNKLDVKRIEYNYAYRNMYSAYYGYGAEQQPQQTPRLEGGKDGNKQDVGAQVLDSVRRLVDRLRHYRPKRS